MDVYVSWVYGVGEMSFLCYYCMFCSSWIASFSTVNLASSSAQFVSSIFLPILWLARRHAACVYHRVCFYVCASSVRTHECVLVCLVTFIKIKWMGVCVCVCLCVLVLWPQSVSQYRTSLFSVPSCSDGSGSGTIIYGSVCAYTVPGARVCLSL